MYQVGSSQELLEARRGGPPRGRRWVSRTVLLLGLTSLLTDLSAEMVATILPLYLVYTLGFSPAQFGVVDGLYQGATAVARLAGGLAGDRLRRHKEVAAVGYALSAVTKLGLLVAGSLSAISAIIFVDRAGKGIRTAPRDALISLSTPRDQLGYAFGVHRALDTAGAMLGPFAAFGLLLIVPGEFDPIFVVSFFVGLLGLGVLVLFVENPGVAPDATDGSVTLAATARLLAAPRFRTLVIAGALLSLATVSDGFLYLNVQRRLDLETSVFPLLYVGTAFAFMLLAVPVGRLADRFGRARVFLGGYIPLLAVYGSLLFPSAGWGELPVYLLLLGLYYAATDGVLMALASSLLPSGLRGSGLALLVTAMSLARLLSSIAFGTIWSWLGVRSALIVFAGLLAVSMVGAAVALARSRSDGRHE